MAGEYPAAEDWAGARGDKWCVQLDQMEGMLSGIDQALIDALSMREPLRIADIGCGGGGPTLAIAQQAPMGSQIIGFDISPALIAAANARTEGSDLPVCFVHANVAEHTPDPAEFDRLVSRFGIMFYDQPAAAFGRLLQWLNPGGKIVFATWANPLDNPWILSVREAVSKVIDIPSMDPHAPGPFRYADRASFIDLLTSVGYRKLNCQQWQGQLAVGGGMTPEAAAEFVLQALSVGELLDQAGESARQAVTADLIARFSQHLRQDQVWMDGCVNIFTGERPATNA